LAISELELVSQAQKGSRAAFDELVSRHQQRVYALAYRILGAAEDASDIQQETFIRAWLSLKKFRGQAAFYTWLHRITVNLCLSRKRKLSSSVEVLPFDEDIRQSIEPGVATCAQNVETTEMVRAALSTVPAPCRALLVLRDIEGRPYEEIARIVGGSIESVRTRLSRARKMLRERMRSYLEGDQCTGIASNSHK